MFSASEELSSGSSSAVSSSSTGSVFSAVSAEYSEVMSSASSFVIAASSSASSGSTGSVISMSGCIFVESVTESIKSVEDDSTRMSSRVGSSSCVSAMSSTFGISISSGMSAFVSMSSRFGSSRISSLMSIESPESGSSSGITVSSIPPNGVSFEKSAENSSGGSCSGCSSITVFSVLSSYCVSGSAVSSVKSALLTIFESSSPESAIVSSSSSLLKNPPGSSAGSDCTGSSISLSAGCSPSFCPEEILSSVFFSLSSARSFFNEFISSFSPERSDTIFSRSSLLTVVSVVSSLFCVTESDFISSITGAD